MPFLPGLTCRSKQGPKILSSKFGMMGLAKVVLYKIYIIIILLFHILHVEMNLVHDHNQCTTAQASYIPLRRI